MGENSLVVQDGRVVAMLRMAEKEWWGRKDGDRESAWHKSALTLVTKMCETYGKESFKVSGTFSLTDLLIVHSCRRLD
jgi:hypothetical protein